MPVFQDIYYPSSTGINTIRALMCSPDAEPRAIIHIVHGIAEHMDRYRDFMSFLAENGFIVVGTDHLGHGKSITKPEEQGYFADKNGWDHVLSDIDKLREMLKSKNPTLPYIFFGHSMGSFLTRTYIINNPNNYHAAVISGTGHQGSALVKSGLFLANCIIKTKGARYISPLIDKIAFGSYNNGFENPRTEYDWLSRDEAVVDAYIADPLSGFKTSVGLFKDMMSGIRFITDQNNINQMNKLRPILFISGANDPVGENGKGVEKAYKAFCDAGLHDVYMKLYPDGRHEMLNELNKETVYKDVLDWINSKL